LDQSWISARNIISSIKTLRSHFESSIKYITAKQHIGEIATSDIHPSDCVYTCARIEAANFLIEFHTNIKEIIAAQGIGSSYLSNHSLKQFIEFGNRLVSLVANIDTLFPHDAGLASAETNE
jgi:hypothetical protein